MALLEMRSITKEFPGVRALDNVNISVEEGEIHALVGENGAGKTTLMNVLSGVHPYGSYSGDVLFDGKICKHQGIKDSERLGIVIIHQELALVPYLSIGENMFLGNEQQRRGIIDWDQTYRKAEEYMSIVGLNENPRTLVKDVSVAKQQLIEIAKALAKNVRLLILDEPTSSLNETESKKILDLLLTLRREKGITSIIISHKLNEVAYCADRITILRDGSTVETLDKRVDDISEERIIRGMVGREMTERFPHRPNTVRDEVGLEVRNFTVYHEQFTERVVVDDVSLKVHKGEVVGIYGLIGSGRTELAMSIFGQAYGTRTSGILIKDGKTVELPSIPKAIEAGLSYVTEDRKESGLLLGSSVMHNITLPRMDFVSKNGRIDRDLERKYAEHYREALDIKAPSIEQLVANLSGGNQQKVLLGKWIYSQPDVLLLDEPTRGVDVGAKYEIYQIINDLAQQGKSILFISSELTEILGMCDRIYVMNEGQIIAEFQRGEATQEEIMNRIMQHSKGEIGA
ncbi:MAG: sugar ABC transporter ATP-binding protein [Bacillota bacterium]|nr:sugar ABC transporter ATP-binding protein [Bacillota bacterium]HOB90943.1 sugar ABC transporter ATP-binding protein [Bacillota bacterium]HPZ55009.1 sugar ABC transporter ATP-binding protein [Bacillota bacterium]HQD17972.1 sugar ABC transporter ATP-binding protein [Bacillota bacterium]